MDIVCVIALFGPVEVEAPLLASELGVTAYEAALLLRVPSPAIVLRTSERSKTLAVLGGLRARGHDAVAFDSAQVQASADMVHVRSFTIGDHGLSVHSTLGTSEEVPWTDFVAFVSAVHRTRSEHVEKTSSRKFDMGRAAMSGGLLLTKKVTTEAVRASDEHTNVCYMFRRRGLPLLAAERRMRYEGLEGDLRPSQIENFSTFLRLVRARAPGAISDERLLAPRSVGTSVQAGPHGAVGSSSVQATDVLAHAVALAVSRGV